MSGVRCQVKRAAFTLIELLMVIAVIGVLAGLLMVAVTAAREKGRRTRAMGETRELAKAWKAYWILYGDTLGWPYGRSNVVMNAEAMKILLAAEETARWNPQKIIFIDAPADATEVGFRDPWNRMYTVDFSSSVEPGEEIYERAVFFPMRRRYHYE